MEETQDLPTNISLTPQQRAKATAQGQSGCPDGEGLTFEIMSEAKTKQRDGNRLQLVWELALVQEDGTLGDDRMRHWVDLPFLLQADGSIKTVDAKSKDFWSTARAFRAIYGKELPQRPTYDKSTKASYVNGQEVAPGVANELKTACDDAIFTKAEAHYNNPGLGVGRRFRADKSTSDRGYPRFRQEEAL